MGSERRFCGAFVGTGTIAAASPIVALSVATSRAGNVSSQLANSLAVTNSVTRLLPQAAPSPGGEKSWSVTCMWLIGYCLKRA